MPIRPDLRPFYRGPAWQATRERILARAKNRCEQCGKPNRKHVWVYSSPACGQYWTRVKGDGQRWTYCFSGLSGSFKLFGAQWNHARRIRVKIGVAHLDHDPSNNADDNLKALCDWCHLHYDKLHHRETRATRKDRSRPIQWEGIISV